MLAGCDTLLYLHHAKGLCVAAVPVFVPRAPQFTVVDEGSTERIPSILGTHIAFAISAYGNGGPLAAPALQAAP